ncbi:MAG TPA: hypothetical protein VE547_08960, partial [Mycobacteriales bacterium]|nr:hypothetical protein [Mycobacteriales bacterium]
LDPAGPGYWGDPTGPADPASLGDPTGPADPTGLGDPTGRRDRSGPEAAGAGAESWDDAGDEDSDDRRDRVDGPGGPGPAPAPRGKRGKHAADPPRRRWTRRGQAADELADGITGADLDRAAEARGRAAEEAADAEELWIDGPPTLDEGHYEPPPPPPVPRLSRPALTGLLVIALGIFLLAAPGTLGLDDRAGLTLGVLAVLGGGALLVLRLRETRADDGPDDGAVV